MHVEDYKKAPTKMEAEEYALICVRAIADTIRRKEENDAIQNRMDTTGNIPYSITE